MFMMTALILTFVLLAAGCVGGMPGGQDIVVTEEGMLIKAGEPQEAPVEAGYRGEVLAGTSSLVLDFNKDDYNAAAQTDKLVVLYFYAGWCPICRAEVPKMYAAFDELGRDDVIGFRVNYNDGDTDDYERALAREYGVAYQHTKVFVKNGERILKSPESWDKERYLQEINNYAG